MDEIKNPEDSKGKDPVYTAIKKEEGHKPEDKKKKFTKIRKGRWNHNNKKNWVSGVEYTTPKFTGKQTLNLEVLESAKIEQHGLFPIAGKPLTKRDLRIDSYPEVKAIANSALSNMATRFANADVNLRTKEADSLDYISIQYNVSTYAQLPTPSWNKDNDGTEWYFEGWGPQGSSLNEDYVYNTYSTQRAVQLADTLQLMVNVMQTNSAFAGLDILMYNLLPNSIYTVTNNVYTYKYYDNNPFWENYKTLGVLGFVDGINTFMLQAVTMLRQFSQDAELFDYFIKKHPSMSAGLMKAKGMMKIKKLTSVLDAIQSQLEYFFCDAEWVDKTSKMLLQCSRTDDSIYTPVIIPNIYFANPLYQLVDANGNGIAFTLALNNGKIDGRQTPYYQSNPGMSLNSSVVNLIQTIQKQSFSESNGDPSTIAYSTVVESCVETWYNNYYNKYNELLSKIQLIRRQAAAYTSFMIQCVQGGLINYSRCKWSREVDVKIEYVPQVAIPLKHPECMMLNSPTDSGQFTASIILEGDKIEKALVDSTRWYEIAPEWMFLISNNTMDTVGRNYVLTLQLEDYQPSQGSSATNNPDVENAATAGSNVLTSVYQLPTIAIYDWVKVYMLNGTYARFTIRKCANSYLQSNSRDSVQNIAITAQSSLPGMWVLSDGTYLSSNKEDLNTIFSYYTPYGQPEIDSADLFYQYWTNGFKNLIDILGIVSYSANSLIKSELDGPYVGPYDIAPNYTTGINVTMRTVYSEMREYTIKSIRMIEPTDPSSVAKFTQVPLH